MKNILFISLLTVGSIACAASREKLNESLCEAVFDGDVDAAKVLLQKGASVDCRCTKNGITPVLISASEGNKQMFDMLHDHDANLHAVDRFGFTTLHVAVFGGKHDKTFNDAKDRQAIIKKLVAEKVQLDRVSNQSHSTPLQVAIRYCRPDLAHPLLQAGASLTKVDRDGQNALDIARANCNEAFFRKLEDVLTQPAKK